MEIGKAVVSALKNLFHGNGRQRNASKKGGRLPTQRIEEFVLDLRQTNIGMSCDEYTVLIVAGPKDMPKVVRERMNQHLDACAYHNSKTFHQSALGIFVNPDLEEEALKIVEKYDLGKGAINLEHQNGTWQ